jgi:hypothetical protein
MEDTRNPLKGLGRKLKLHFIIPALYVLIMILALIFGHGR